MADPPIADMYIVMVSFDDARVVTQNIGGLDHVVERKRRCADLLPVGKSV